MKTRYEGFSWLTKTQVKEFAKQFEDRGYKLEKIEYFGVDARNATFSGNLVLVKLSLLERFIKWIS